MASHASAAILNAKKKKQGKRKPLGGAPFPPKKAQPACLSDSESDFGSDEEEDPSDYKKGILSPMNK